jgi:hypothetical protein
MRHMPIAILSILLSAGTAMDEIIVSPQTIKAIAAEHGIPMVENVPLARALAREVQIGQPIPAQTRLVAGMRESRCGGCSDPVLGSIR